MSIATAIKNAQERVSAVYDKLSEKGATIPADKNLDNLVDTIDSVSTGGGSGYKGNIYRTFDEETGTLSSINGAVPEDYYKGVKVVDDYGLSAAYSTSAHSNQTVTSLAFPDLEKVNNYGMFQVAYNCKGLTSVEFPKLATLDGSNAMQSAFYNCTGLTSVEFPKLTTVSQYAIREAFYRCTGLTSISFPELTTVGIQGMYQAFYDCTGLTSISFPELTTVSQDAIREAFYSCRSLTSVAFPKLTTVGIQGMYQTFYDCTGLTSISFPELTTVDTFGIAEAFRGCTGLTSVSFPAFTSIGDYGLHSAFYNCTELTSVSFPALTSIGSSGLYYAFYGCTGLTSISFPELTTVGQEAIREAFYGCTGLTSVSFPALTSESFSSYTSQFNRMLYGVTGCTVHFPCDLEDTIGSWSDVTSGFGGTDTVVLFDIGATVIHFNIPEESTIYFTNEITRKGNLVYIKGTETTYTCYNPNYTPYTGTLENLEPGVQYELNVEMTDDDGATLTIETGVEDSVITYTYGEDNYSYTGKTIVVPKNTEIKYLVKTKGYEKIEGTTSIADNTTLTLELEVSKTIEVDLSYPFETSDIDLSTLVDGTNFVIDESTSSIMSGSASYTVNNGKSFGYIQFTTPDEETELSISGYVSSESSYDFGGAYIGTALYEPTDNSILRNKTTDGNGSWLFVQSGSNKSATAYTTTLQPNTTYYLCLTYAKDGSGNTNDDRMYITNIKFIIKNDLAATE